MITGAAVGEYHDWTRIDYQPAIAELTPAAVLAHLAAGSTALDIGCNKGDVSLYLARHGLNVVGIDLNEAAVAAAKQRAADAGLSGLVNFRVADVLDDPPDGRFDVVLLIRILTCFPDLSAWHPLLERVGALVGPQGYFYVHDFLLFPESPAYSARYAEGERRGWRPGNFAVNDAAGDLSFIAHHHSEEESASIMAPWNRVYFNVHESLSLNGNACRMFEFLGRKPAA
jgi:SAM-dependent methyltransferase